MQEQYQQTSRAWASPVHASTIKKRHKFGVDGRILLVPILFPCAIAIPFGKNIMQQAMFLGIAGSIWLLAKILWEINPYFLDDFMAELRLPKTLSDEKYVKAPQRHNRRGGMND